MGDLNADNRYTYAGDDPVNAVDPSGKGDVFLCALGVIGAIGGIGAGLLGIIIVVIATGPEAAGLILLAAYLGLAVAFLTYIGCVSFFDPVGEVFKRQDPQSVGHERHQ